MKRKAYVKIALTPAGRKAYRELYGYTSHGIRKMLALRTANENEVLEGMLRNNRGRANEEKNMPLP